MLKSKTMPHGLEGRPSNNPNGRPVGALSSKTRAILKKLEGKADSLELLSEVVASSDAPLMARISAATSLARYQHPACPRLLRRKIDLPVATSVSQAITNIALIGSMAAQRKIGLDEANDLVAIQKAYIEMQVGIDHEARLTILEQAWERNPIVPPAVITGGLPPLPLSPEDGELIMPQLAPPSTNGGDPPDEPSP
jgi:hypothetical protein